MMHTGGDDKFCLVDRFGSIEPNFLHKKKTLIKRLGSIRFESKIGLKFESFTVIESIEYLKLSN